MRATREVGNSMSNRLTLTATQYAPEPRTLRHEIQTVVNQETLKALRREWEELTATARDYSSCLSYAYCELAASILFQTRGRVEVIKLYDNRGLCALWPLAIHRKGLLRIAKALSCGADEEYGGPLVRGDAGDEVFNQLARATSEIKADVLQIRFVVINSPLHQVLIARSQSWLLPLVPKGLRDNVPGYSIAMREYATWKDFTAARPKLFTNSRRYQKRLNTHGTAEIGWCKTKEDAEAVITWLFGNKRRWAESRDLHTQYLKEDHIRDFFIKLAQRTDLTTTPLVTYTKLNGAPIAAMVNLIGPRTFEGYFTTYDEAFADCSPGNLMHEFCMKWAHENGRDFDFRPIHSAYKARWANRETQYSTLTIFLTLRGRLAELNLISGYMARLMGRLRASIKSRKASKPPVGTQTQTE
jgi:CelD/BcsL family acetyltransferase involved in cellulose biosynthesis